MSALSSMHGGRPPVRLVRELEWRVTRTVARVVRELPGDLRRLAENVPVRCEWKMAGHWLDDGVPEDSMGLFSGPAFGEPVDPDCLESPCITLFLAELWDCSEEDCGIFDDEVRTTYLHEFGHYLGLDEQEVEARGLA